MELAELKERLVEIEDRLEAEQVVELGRFDTPAGPMVVLITERLRKRCRKGKVWKSNAMLTALKNIQYGLDRTRPRSRGGSDGVFLLDRGFQPPNAMMNKLFDRFLDKPDPLVAVIRARLSASAGELVPVRVVSHHMRLLGVLVERAGGGQLTLVDYDDT
jgi:hypothetical protein